MNKFYPRDSGEGAIEGHPEEVEMAYRIASSIPVNGMRYVFTGMRNGKAIYKRTDEKIDVVEKAEKTSRSERDQSLPDDLPSDSYVTRDFVGRSLTGPNGRRYKHMTPPRQLADGRWVYIPM